MLCIFLALTCKSIVWTQFKEFCLPFQYINPNTEHYYDKAVITWWWLCWVLSIMQYQGFIFHVHIPFLGMVCFATHRALTSIYRLECLIHKHELTPNISRNENIHIIIKDLWASHIQGYAGKYLATFSSWGEFITLLCCCRSVAKSYLTLCNTMNCSMPGFPVLHYLKFMSIESVMLSNHLILCHLLFLPSIFPRIWVFSNESALHIRWPKYWSFRFSISPSNEYSRLISFSSDWFDLLAVQGTLHQYHNLKTLTLQRSVFFMVQLSYPYMTTGETIGLTISTFVDKIMSLLCNTLSLSLLFLKGASSFKKNFMAAVSL